MKKTKIELKNLAFFARHGLMKEEEKLGQRFCVDVEVELDPALDFKSDDPEQTLNYVELYDRVKAIFEGTRFKLIETCAEAIADGILDGFERAHAVRVMVKKPSVPVDCICDYFAVEVTRCR